MLRISQGAADSRSLRIASDRRQGLWACLALFFFFFHCYGVSHSATPGFKTKILIVGIDGAEWSIIDRLLKGGRLPSIKSLIENGARGRLKTLQPTLSPAIWTTIATGKPPGDHGILGFDGVPGQDMKTLPTSQMRKVKAVWNIVSEAKGTVGIVNWWVTWPAEKVNGFVVSDRAVYSRMEAAVGEDVNSEYDAYPEKLIEEIRPFIAKPSDITPEETRRFMDISGEDTEKFVRNSAFKMGELLSEFKYVHQSDKSALAIGKHLLEREKPDLFGIYFSGVDVVSHLFWHFMEPQYFPNYKISEDLTRRMGKVIENYYVFLDGLIGEVLKSAGEKYTVILVSDHGFGPTGYLPWSGGHGKITPGAPDAPDGMLVMSGREIRKGASVSGAHVLDMLPTILFLMGMPVAEDMKGKILVDAMEDGFVKNNPVKHIKTYEEKEVNKKGTLISPRERDKDLIEKFKGLGYIQ